MYVAVGTPRVFDVDAASDDATDYVCMQRSQCGNFFAVCSPSSISLWCCKPTLLLSRIERVPGDDDDSTDGDNVALCWKPDSTAVAVLTSVGQVQLYALRPVAQSSGGKLLQYRAATEHHWIAGPGQARGAPNLVLHWAATMSLPRDEQVNCMVGIKAGIVLATKGGTQLAMVLWSGEVDMTPRYFQPLLDSFRLRNAAIDGIHYNAMLDLFGFILADKSVFISFRKDFGSADGGEMIASPLSTQSMDLADKSANFYCIDVSDSGSKQTTATPSCMDLNTKHRLLAVGTTSGSVHIYHLTDQYQLRFSHRLEPPIYQTRRRNESPIVSLAWTSDGHALAVASAQSGFKLWSVYGRQLCYHADMDVTPDSADHQNCMQLYLHGAVDIFWGPGNYELFILSARSTHGQELYAVPFSKYALAACNIRDNVRTPFMLAEDRLLIYSGLADMESSNVGSNSSFWQFMKIPNEYLTENWPIRYAAASSDGKRIAVAGRRGVAHCTLASSRWKLFGNQQQERAMRCTGGLVWFRDTLIVSCHNCLTASEEIRFYPGDMNLDNANLAAQVISLPRRVVSMSILHTQLLVYSVDNVLRQFCIAESGDKSYNNNKSTLTAELVDEFDLSTIISAPMCVQSIDLFFPVTGLRFEEVIKSAFFMILHQGRLEVAQFDRDENEWEHTLFSENVEFCWSLFSRSPVGDLHNALWTFDGHRAKIWTNIFLEMDDSLKWVCTNLSKPLTLEFDFYPISVLFHKGIIVGVEQTVNTSSASECVAYRCAAKTYLFLHHMVHWLLSQKLLAEAVNYARNYEHFGYFVHSMEILLHRILEKESETLVGFRHNALLPLAVKFLKNFDRFHEIVVQCARKTEVAMWDYLFDIVGDPKELFNYCLDRDDLQTATSALIILQTLEPYSVSSKLQVDLLEKTLEAEDFALCAEIVRYLTMVNARDSSQSSVSSESAGGRTGQLLAISTEEEQTFYIDILISRHARKLMQSHAIRTVGRLASTLQFPLVEWLNKERNRSAMIRDMQTVFRCLHVQYEWPFPAGGSRTDVNSATAIKVGRQRAHQRTRSDDSVVQLQEAAESGIPAPATQRAGSETALGGVGSRRATFDTATNFSRNPSVADLIGENDNSSTIESPSIMRRRAKSYVPEYLRRRTSHRGDLEREMTDMMMATRNAKCYSWSVLLATMLQDVGAVAEVLHMAKRDKESAGLVDEYQWMLQATGSAEYMSFGESVNRILSLS